MLELAVLGLLHETPMHGYELRKRLHDSLGAFRTLSCGTLYPTLRRMLRAGLIEEEPGERATHNRGRRNRRVYQLTAPGADRFTELVGDCGPRSCEDDAFGVHVAFFAHTPAETRMRILEARRRRIEERREKLRAVLNRPDRGREHAPGPQPGALDHYTLALHRLGLDHSEREVRWLDELIERERAGESGVAERAGSAGSRGHDT